MVKKKNGPGLWQIFYSDLKPDKDISGRVGSVEGATMAERDPSPSAEALFSVEDRDDSDHELENDPFITSNMNGEAGAPPKPKRTMVVVRERELNSSNPFNKTKSKTLSEGCEMSMDSINSDDEGQASRAARFLGNRFRIRRDSDLELALPATSSQRVMKKFSYCCIVFFNMPIWKTYFLVALLAVIMVILYVVIILAIVMGLGG